MSEETTRTKQLPVPGKDMDSIMENLETGVAVLFTSDRYQEYLRTMAKFHNYSFNNTLLIAMQRPDATLVTSYKNWQSMGRQVMKGEKGITIMHRHLIKKSEKEKSWMKISARFWERMVNRKQKKSKLQFLILKR